MRITSISKPLAVKILHSFAAKRGNAVMVNAALEILVFPRRSWLKPDLGKDKISPIRVAIVSSERQVGWKLILMVFAP
ncbi:MAG TPA: hypothetical protein VE616_13000 [Candidatus Udaeobacter sp.]|nr:hypothetical protein [Candidatus Udaeobacter sp.]